MEENTMKGTIFVLAFFSLTLPAFGQGVDPMLGVWKWNPEKSMWGDTPTPKSMTVTWAAEGPNTIIATLDEVNAQGRQLKVVYTMTFDGQPHPTTGSQLVDAGTYVRVGNIVSQNDFKNGKAVDIGQVTLVSDKILQGIYEGIFPNGKQFRIVNIWDKP
jgi:hypothetical protein